MKKQLDDITEIMLGYQTRGKVRAVKDSPYRIVQIKDFDDDLNLDIDHLTPFEPERKPEPFFLKPGDVLFLARGHRNWSVSIEDDLPKTVATVYFFILRSKIAELLPAYLAWYLNQKPAQDYLTSRARRGSHMPIVPKSELAYLTVEIPPLEIQRQIVELDRLAASERRLEQIITGKKDELRRAISLDAIKRNTK